MGGPFEGKYRDASIIHDFYCSKRHRPWKQVHRMFFDGMITSGVGKGRAYVMYAGVYAGGPRWTDMDIHNALIIERSLGIVQLPAGSRNITFNFAKGEGKVKVSERVGDVRSKRVSEALTIDITPVKRSTRKPPIRVAHHLTEEDVAILEQTLKTRGASLESIEQQMDDFIKERKRQSRKS
jgi:hypothetical protein